MSSALQFIRSDSLQPALGRADAQPALRSASAAVIPLELVYDRTDPDAEQAWIEDIYHCPDTDRVWLLLMLGDGQAADLKLPEDSLAWLDLQVGQIVLVKPLATAVT
ncbi:hypothetical protein I0Q12_06445 [Rhodococcus sp. CX]|uniref:hypothetical protein n=2 Tax=unclassified Rhodococcus (in: high G+C Gram-positive bacteria) TaxID=192944 RepID=UPI0018CDB3FE|nr:hypothetical protein [Rhodococcus sp. CX]MBH0119184.1 hypothetical protein [Rhodococcus sp. CX]